MNSVDQAQSTNGLNNTAARSTKADKSSKFFKSTRVDSCSHVVVKNGVAEAVPFRPSPQKDDGPKQHFTASLSHETHKVFPNMHVGMNKKPLVPYHPNSYRNRLPVADAKKPPKNSSQIEFGDRSAANKKHFVTSKMNTHGFLANNDPITNGGILAEKTKWHHYLQNK